jgi:flagellum-specific peptidoglycan hydrolase FlgJ
MTTPPVGVIAAACTGAAKWGVPASVALAQWALESGWGLHMPMDSFNPFGIKARTNPNGVIIDPCVWADTTECIAGKTEHIKAAFRKFPSILAAFDYHDELLATAHVYAKAMAVKDNPNAFANALSGVYATDPDYGAKLIAIMKGSNLYQYDV